MAINNSYSPVATAFFVFFDKGSESYYPSPALADVDSTGTAVPRIESMTQREDENTGDIVGKIYNSAGGAITLVSLQYSTVGITGPWVSTTIISDDDNYSFPAIGTAAGTAFNIPFGISAEFSGNLWMRIEISY